MLAVANVDFLLLHIPDFFREQLSYHSLVIIIYFLKIHVYVCM